MEGVDVHKDVLKLLLVLLIVRVLPTDCLLSVMLNKLVGMERPFDYADNPSCNLLDEANALIGLGSVEQRIRI